MEPVAYTPVLREGGGAAGGRGVGGVGGGLAEAHDGEALLVGLPRQRRGLLLRVPAAHLLCQQRGAGARARAGVGSGAGKKGFAHSPPSLLSLLSLSLSLSPLSPPSLLSLLSLCYLCGKLLHPRGRRVRRRRVRPCPCQRQHHRRIQVPQLLDHELGDALRRLREHGGRLFQTQQHVDRLRRLRRPKGGSVAATQRERLAGADTGGCRH